MCVCLVYYIAQYKIEENFFFQLNQEPTVSQDGQVASTSAESGAASMTKVGLVSFNLAEKKINKKNK